MLFQRKKKLYLAEILNKSRSIRFQQVDDYPFVSMVFPNINGKDNCVDLLNSLNHLNYPKKRMEIIVIDSNSSDGSQEAIKNKFIEMKNDNWYNLQLMDLKYDKGVPYSYNLAMEIVNSDYNYIWKLDNDVVVDSNSLYELVITAESSNKIGVVGGKVFYYFDPEVIWFTRGDIIWWLGAGRHLGKNKKDCEKYDSIEIAEYLAGCAVLIKKDALMEVNGFYEDYFVYFDDTDFSLNCSKKGYLNIFNPTAKIWHKVNKTTKKDSNRFVYYRTRNSFVFLRRNYSVLHFVVYFTIFSLILFPFRFLKYIASRNFPAVKGLLNGLKDGLKVKVKKS